MQVKNMIMAWGVAVALPFGASATLLWNVDFSGATGNMSGAGAIGSAGDFWNVAGTNPTTTPVAISLNDSSNDPGNAIGLNYFTGAGGFGFTAGAGANPADLMDGWGTSVNGGGGSSYAQITYEFSGLLPNTQFDVVAYGASQAGTDRGTHFFDTVGGAILGSTDGSIVDITDPGAAGAAYTTFSITSSGTGTATLYSNFNSGSSAQGPVNGFQLMAIPEPSSLALIGLGLVALGWARRRL